MKSFIIIALLAMPCLAEPQVYIVEQIPFINSPSPRFNYWEIRNQHDIIIVTRLHHVPHRIDLFTIETIPQTDPPAPRFAMWPTPDGITYQWFFIDSDGSVTPLS